MSRSRLTARLAAGALLLTLTGCAGSFAGASGRAASSSTTPALSTAPPSATTPMDGADPATDIPTTVPPDVPVGQRDPGDLTVAVMSAYVVAAPVDPDSWYRRIAPYLTDEARRDYAYTDPANVLAHQLVGAPTVTRQTDYLATTSQGTDAGAYTVSFSRDGQGLWKVYRIDPPAAAQPAGS